jgi:hypothetical protein
MKHMNRKYKKEDALLREHKESTLEKNQAKRVSRRIQLEKQFSMMKKDRF